MMVPCEAFRRARKSAGSIDCIEDLKDFKG
jgi:hypothetical protein